MPTLDRARIKALRDREDARFLADHPRSTGRRRPHLQRPWEGSHFAAPMIEAWARRLAEYTAIRYREG